MWTPQGGTSRQNPVFSTYIACTCFERLNRAIVCSLCTLVNTWQRFCGLVCNIFARSSRLKAEEEVTTKIRLIPSKVTPHVLANIFIHLFCFFIFMLRKRLLYCSATYAEEEQKPLQRWPLKCFDTKLIIVSFFLLSLFCSAWQKKQQPL